MIRSQGSSTVSSRSRSIRYLKFQWLFRWGRLAIETTIITRSEGIWPRLARILTFGEFPAVDERDKDKLMPQEAWYHQLFTC